MLLGWQTSSGEVGLRDGERPGPNFGQHKDKAKHPPYYKEEGHEIYDDGPATNISPFPMCQNYLGSLPSFLRGIPQEFTCALLDPKYFWPLLLIAVMCGQMYFVNKSRRAILALAGKIRQEHSLIPSQEVSGETSALMGYSNELERIQQN